MVTKYYMKTYLGSAVFSNAVVTSSTLKPQSLFLRVELTSLVGITVISLPIPAIVDNKDLSTAACFEYKTSLPSLLILMML